MAHANEMNFRFMQKVIEKARAGFELDMITYWNGYCTVRMSRDRQAHSIDLIIQECPRTHDPLVFIPEPKQD